MDSRFLLMRHAQTDWNRTRRIQGQRDIPLNTTGRSMAVSWAEYLGALPGGSPLAVVSSDLVRAVDTAKLVTSRLGIPHHTDNRLREQDWGAWVGLSIEEVLATDEYERQVNRGWEFRPPGGESRAEVLARARAALEAAAAKYEPGTSILVVTHQGVLRCLTYHIAGHSMLPGKSLAPKGYVVYEIRLDPTGDLRHSSIIQDLPS